MPVLSADVERARRKLNEALIMGYSEKSCYQLSLEVDGLLEKYINFLAMPPHRLRNFAKHWHEPCAIQTRSRKKQ